MEAPEPVWQWMFGKPCMVQDMRGLEKQKENEALHNGTRLTIDKKCLNYVAIVQPTCAALSDIKSFHGIIYYPL